jgi:hypothetical protein
VRWQSEQGEELGSGWMQSGVVEPQRDCFWPELTWVDHRGVRIVGELVVRDSTGREWRITS